MRCMSADAVCGRCGKAHCDVPCTASEFCVNCSGNHSANSNQCPRYLVEREIQKIRVTEKVSFPEARRRYNARNPVDMSRSFAGVAGHRRADTSVQTDVRTPGILHRDAQCQVGEDDFDKLQPLRREKTVACPRVSSVPSPTKKQISSQTETSQKSPSKARTTGKQQVKSIISFSGSSSSVRDDSPPENCSEEAFREAHRKKTRKKSEKNK